MKYSPPTPHILFPAAEAEGSIIERFERQAYARPEHPAVRARENEVSYGELAAAARAVGSAIAESAGRGSRVALLLDDPIEQVTAMLGVLAGGAAFVPLAPDHPTARLSEVVGDAEPSAILTSAAHYVTAESLAPPGCRVIGLAEAIRRRGRRGDGSLMARPEDPAYLIYTSGSTGQPKGVIQSHRTVLHNVRMATNVFGLSPDDRVTMLSSYVFAATMSDVFGALLNGAALLPRPLSGEGLAGLEAWLQKEEATVCFMVPTAFRRAVQAMTGRVGLERLRLLKLAGEALLRSDVEQFRRRFRHGTLLVNALGCTEINVVAHLFLDHDTPLEGARVPVGYSVPGVDVRVLDEEGAEVPPGVEGVLEIRSAWMSPGYWRRPELTAAAFRAVAPGITAFRTGDRGRRGPDGLLEHLGRADERLKVAGVTVEPAEVEAALVESGVAREAVAGPWRARNAGESLLVAWYVPAQEGLDPLSVLRSRLPAPLLPALVVPIERLPVLPSGKVDRGALPTPGAPVAPKPIVSEPPRDRLEGFLLSLLQQVLRRKPLSIDDDFFAHGGDSLAALTFAAEIEEELGVRLPPEALVRAPTVRGLAALVRGGLGAPRGPLVVLQGQGTGPTLFCLPTIDGGVFMYRALARRLAPDHRVAGIQARGLDGREEPDRTIEAMALRYESSIRAAQPSGPYCLLGFSGGGVATFETARRLQASGERVGLLALVDTYLPSRSRKFKGEVHRWLHGMGAAASDAAGAGIQRLILRILERLARAGESRKLERKRTRHPVPHRGERRQKTLTQTWKKASKLFVPRPYRGDVLVFETDEGATKEPARRPGNWQAWVTGCTEIVTLAGVHRDPMLEPGVEVLARRVAAALREAGA